MRLDLLLALVCVLICSGCVRRSMTVTSDPPGALVYMNNQEIGRTPFTRDFTWYGTYDVQVRAEGYQTLKTETPVISPIWQWPPFDLLAELLPLHDRRQIHYTLLPASDDPADSQVLLDRAEEMRGELRPSRSGRR
jgi:hypothetical protein